jgi:hypothetical protein
MSSALRDLLERQGRSAGAIDSALTWLSERATPRTNAVLSREVVLNTYTIRTQSLAASNPLAAVALGAMLNRLKSLPELEQVRVQRIENPDGTLCVVVFSDAPESVFLGAILL